MLCKEHPYNTVPCGDCWEDRVDKLLVWEPGTNSTGVCLCRGKAALPTTLVSRGETLSLQLIVDSAHAASSYFKHPTPLFEARYEFVHGPLCGPPLIPPTTDGELHFPFYEALGYVEPPKSIRCIWELRVSRERDLWLHVDKIKFASRTCEEGRLELFLPARPNEPFLSVCGENVSALKEMPILSAAELAASPVPGEHPGVKIQFLGSVSPARTAFKIAWTELFHLPRNADGSLMTSRLTEGGDGCEYLCPGEAGLCIPARLVCNGVVNCPNVTGEDSAIVVSGSGSDEAPELCARSEVDAVNWLAVGLGAAGGGILALSCLIVLCRACCCHKRPGDDDDIDVPY